MNLTLVKKKKETKDAVSFIFECPEGFNFRSGQFNMYKLLHPQPDRRGVRRFFTISSAPHDKVIMITTRFQKEGGSSFKKALYGLKIGNQIYAEGPRGGFTLSDPQTPCIFIAGGLGATPFRSILLDLAHHRVPSDIILLYASKNSKEIVFKKEFDSIAHENQGIKIHYIIFPNRVDNILIQKIAPDYLKRVFYISGPELMVFAFEKSLPKIGVVSENIKRDYFPGYTWPL